MGIAVCIQVCLNDMLLITSPTATALCYDMFTDS
jgi:hypothetical protein